MSDGRWVLLIASELGGTNSVSDRAMDRLCDAITAEGYEVIRTSTPEDGLSMVQSDPSYSAILLDWDLEQEHQFDERAALKIIRAVRRRNKRVPIFLYSLDRTLVRRAAARSDQAGARVHPPFRRYACLYRQPGGLCC